MHGILVESLELLKVCSSVLDDHTYYPLFKLTELELVRYVPSPLLPRSISESREGNVMDPGEMLDGSQPLTLVEEMLIAHRAAIPLPLCRVLSSLAAFCLCYLKTEMLFC
jgi:hypothetical protein